MTFTLSPATGDLDQRLDLQSHNGTLTARGAPDYAEGNWTTDATVWGKIEALSGAEIEQARQLSAQATSKITVHFYTSAGYTPTEKKRFKHKDGRVFYIGYVADPDESRARRLCLAGDIRS